MWDKQQIDPTDLAMISTYDYNPRTGDIAEDDVFDGVAFVHDFTFLSAIMQLIIPTTALH